MSSGVKYNLKNFHKFAMSVNSGYAQNVLLSLLGNYEKNIIQKIRPGNFFILVLKFLLIDYKVRINGASNDQSKIFLWPVQIQHLDFMIPVFKSLPNETRPLFICANDKIKKILLDQNLPYLDLEIKQSVKLSRTNIKRGFVLLGIIKRAFFSKYFENRKLVYLITTLEQFSYYDIYSQVFNKVQMHFNPKYHILGFEFSMVCLPINILSNKFGLGTGTIQHGALNENLMPYSICGDVFCWDSFNSNLIRNKVNRIYTTGSPNVNHKGLDVKLLLDFRQCFEFKSVILVCFSGPGHNISVGGHKKNLNVLLKMIKKLKDHHFVIKLHSKDLIDYYTRFFYEPNVTIVDKHLDLYKFPIAYFLAHSILMITGASTVAIEALQKGIPVISLDLNNELTHIEFIRDDIFYQCISENEFEKSIFSILNRDFNFQQKKVRLLKYKASFDELQNGSPEVRIASIILNRIEKCVV